MATASMLWWPQRLCSAIADDGHFVVRYDHRDTGESTTGEPGQVDYSVEDMTADLIGVMDVLGVDSAHLVGMSLGGLICQIMAVSHPDRVRSLTLIGSEPLGADNDLPGIDERFMQHFDGMAHLDWTVRDDVEEFLVGIGRLSAGSPSRFDEGGTRRRVEAKMARAVHIARAFNYAMVTTSQDWSGAVDRISQPTLIIHGTHDPILPVQNGEAIAAHVDDARLHLLDGAGHELNPLDLDEIHETIVDFVTSADKR